MALDLREDRGASFGELRVVRALLLDGADLHLVEGARLLLAVAGDERDAGPLLEQLRNGADPLNRQGELLGDAGSGVEGGGGRGGHEGVTH